ncbi:hypothetical protein Tsubulata_033032 [Turnera subulata]|uniref:ENTH domain-containing protein n=1 Tax=Turnera subulata TaxID=218843 RepID=A0A9Q0FQN6_9ROSI|nr:hypothetical protein Tsubulata_033032 [Turnera subulata]
MAPSKIRRAIGAVKDKTSIGLAKVNNSDSLSDLDVAIVKATRHEEYPADERHIREILSLTSYARSHVSACVNTLSRRLSKTKCWTVALKTLMLIQRLLTEGDPSYEQEIFFATRRGTRLLNMSDFRDTSQSNSWDYSAFVRTYALFLDERLEFRMQGKRGKRSVFGYDEEEEEEEATPPAKGTPLRDMRNEHVFSRVTHLQQLLDRFLACRPTARENRVVIVALYPIVKDSFQLYYEVTDVLGILLDRFMELDVPESIKVHEIFCRAAKQLDELDKFYCWSKSIGIARSSEYPEVEKITRKKLDLMDEFIRDKSLSEHSPRAEKQIEEEVKEEPVEVDMNEIKALPPPESVPEPPVEVKEAPKREEKIELIDTTLEADLLNLGEDAMSSQDHANSLALALFDGGAPAAGPPGAPAWQAFADDTADWETALVESASHLSHQHASLGGGFDMMLLDGMYQRGAITAAMSAPAFGHTGSASSVALGSAGKPAMLALPAPPTTDGNGTAAPLATVDPFAASLSVPPPAYVQMTEMEKKQKLLVEEQLIWQQYKNNGMQGQHALEKLQANYPYNYNTGSYARGY